MAYISGGYLVGGFLRAVFSNKLSEAIGLADTVNLKALPSIMRFIYNCAPSPCWGSLEKYEEWLRISDAVREGWIQIQSTKAEQVQNVLRRHSNLVHDAVQRIAANEFIKDLKSLKLVFKEFEDL